MAIATTVWLKSTVNMHLRGDKCMREKGIDGCVDGRMGKGRGDSSEVVGRKGFSVLLL